MFIKLNAKFISLRVRATRFQSAFPQIILTPKISQRVLVIPCEVSLLPFLACFHRGLDCIFRLPGVPYSRWAFSIAEALGAWLRIAQSAQIITILGRPHQSFDWWLVPSSLRVFPQFDTLHRTRLSQRFPNSFLGNKLEHNLLKKNIFDYWAILKRIIAD